ncbi:LicD family protein [Beutenbergia cavernae DSM 12333]|uniref:LicD family protein n=1 Tax=Beutenbergia cavernae (strain ATCC BAA-8 / DSM 12333 / CCUG 43141 / JCM 11478 / NBRC 16432 / NCIMB 13614 / HKI 0122) TaxID=471853 RepID=C5C131_BEUC1|nr:methyltransferase domain-containing protein [Beutenbergia cavernae]ACQ79435.1 LicD family protein [Beutenbergia cavernae DSM 12333]
MSDVGHLTATSASLTFPERPPTSVPSLDVVVNGHRVWSIDLVSKPARRARRSHRWPEPLVPYLDGTATITVRDSVSGRTLWATDVALGTSLAAIAVVDDHGRHLAVNKWGRLGRSFEGDATGLRVRILDRLDELLEITREIGLRPFVVGGTLLGAVREGTVLSHDDDADLAYLSEHTHPADLALESFGIERELTGRGLEVLRHSAAHLQVTFRTPDGAVDGYVDLFTAFFKDGYINQPFHVRGRMESASMLPFSTVTLEGRSYPAPARPADWLVINYDENWHTPLPGYRLHTPRATVRRFQNWFGTPNFQHEFWEDSYSDGAAHADGPQRAHLLHDLVAPGSQVLDLGTGLGRDAISLAGLGHRVIALDYSAAALRRARDADRAGAVQWRPTNLVDPRQTADLLELVGAAEAPVHALASHLVERMGDLGRANVWRLLRQVVRRGGVVVLVMDTVPAANVSFDDPTTWHLEVPDLQQELGRFGLHLLDVRRLDDDPRDHERGTVSARLVEASKEGDW